jgi:protein-tyrosine phosphatase
VPILDAGAPTESQFQTAVEVVTQWRATGRSVLIHCAQGHGRTATIAAAVLVRLQLAADAGEALSRVRAVRPFAIPSREQKAALMKYLASARLDRAVSNLSPTEKP